MVCAAGQYGDAGAVASTCSGKCAAGRFGGNGATTSTCDLPCAQGRFGLLADLRTNSLCSGECPAGTYGAAGSSTAVCSDCPEGVLCGVATGVISGAGGVSIANGDLCSPGKFNGVKNQKKGVDVCSLCDAGRFSSAYGKDACDDCPAGKYSAEAGATACDDCPAGKYSEVPAKTLLTDCKTCTMAGSAAPFPGSGLCSMPFVAASVTLSTFGTATRLTATITPATDVPVGGAIRIDIPDAFADMFVPSVKLDVEAAKISGTLEARCVEGVGSSGPFRIVVHRAAGDATAVNLMDANTKYIVTLVSGLNVPAAHYIELNDIIMVATVRNADEPFSMRLDHRVLPASKVAPAGLSYGTTSLIFTRLSNIPCGGVRPLALTAGGGVYSVTPVAQFRTTGMDFDTATGTISGKPSITSDNSYTIAVTNSAGASTTTLRIVVQPRAPKLVYARSDLAQLVTLKPGMVFVPIIPTVPSGYDAPAHVTSSPLLPAGILLSNTGEVSGAPATHTDGARDYTLVVTNGNRGGDALFVIRIEVKRLTPRKVVYDTFPLLWQRGVELHVNPTQQGTRSGSLELERIVDKGGY